MRALVTGATGFVGKRLLKALDSPVVLSRDPQRAKATLGNVEAYRWEPEKSPAPAEAFRGVDTVFHLAGDSVAQGRWNEEKKARIRNSRVLGTRNLVASFFGLKERPKLLVSASAVGYYGSRGEELLEESAPPGSDFLAHVCKEWEAEAAVAEKIGIRVVQIRIGVVLGDSGGALSRMLLPFKLGLGGRLGSGAQWMPWVHIDDVVSLMIHAAQKTELRGPINAVAPECVTNREFTKALARTLKRPAIFPVPTFMLRLALGEFAEVLLGSQRVVPRIAEKSGYQFHFAHLEDALKEILK